jgi:hypothetical protein
VNTRTKDLIDMLLLIEQGNLDNRRVASAIATTFGKRATHDVPRRLEPPPAEWKPTFEALAGECGLKTNLSHGFEAAQGFVAGIGERMIENGMARNHRGLK